MKNVEMATQVTSLLALCLIAISGCDSASEVDSKLMMCDQDESALGLSISQAPIQGGHVMLTVVDSTSTPVSQEEYPGIEWDVESSEPIALVPSAFAYTPAFVPPTEGDVVVDVTLYDPSGSPVDVRCLRLTPGN